MNTIKKLVAKCTNGNITTKVYDHIHNGSCQCFKDCNCSEDKGKVMYQTKTYSNPLSKKQNGETKEFDSLKSCLDSFNSKVKV